MKRLLVLLIVVCCLSVAHPAEGSGLRATGSGVSPPFHLDTYALRLVPLSPDPNPDISEVMQGGTFSRYYRAVDHAGSPLAGSQVGVLIDGQPYSFEVAADGLVTIRVAADDFASAPGTYDASITGIDSEPTYPITFQVDVKDREYDRAMRFQADFDAGISDWGVVAENALGWALIGTDDSPDDSRWHRFSELGGTFGAGVGIGAQLTVNDYVAGAYAGAGAEVGAGIFQEEDYVFAYPPQGDWEYSVAPLVVLLDPITGVPIGGALVQLAIWLLTEATQVGDILEDGYSHGSLGTDIWGGGHAEAELGFDLFPSVVSSPYIELAADVNGSLHQQHTVTHYANPEAVGYGYGLLGYFSASGQCDFDYSPRGTWLQAFDAPRWLDILDQEYQPSFAGQLAVYGEVRARADESVSVILDLRRVPGGSTEYADRIILTGEPDLVEAVLDLCLVPLRHCDELVLSGWSGNIALSAHSAFHVIDDFFVSLGQVQEQYPDGLTVEYERLSEEVVTSDPLTLSFSIGLAISGSLGFDGGVFREKQLVLERGRWTLDGEFPLEEYEDDAYTSVYDDVNDVPQALLDNILTADTILDSAFTYYETTVLASQTTFDLEASELLLPADALPEGTLIGAYNWGWWGNESSDRPDRLEAEEFTIRDRARQILQRTHELYYGVGGFYEFVPEDLTCAIPATFTLAYSDTEVVGFDEATLRMYRWDEPSMSWLLVGGEAFPDSNFVRAEITGFGGYTLAPTMPGSEFGMTAEPDTLGADGMSTSTVTSDVIYNNSGTVVEDGTLFTIATTGGEVLASDADPGTDGIQVAASDGRISFDIRATDVGWIAYVTATSVLGDAVGHVRIWFVDATPPEEPSGFGGTLAAINAVLLSWEPNEEDDLFGYLIYYDTDPNPPWDGTSPYGPPSPISVEPCSSRVVYVPHLADSTYWFGISAVDMSGNESEMAVYGGISTVETEGDEENRPSRLTLEIADANPSSGQTVFRYALPEPGWAQLEVFDLTGRRVAKVLDELQPAGRREVAWDANGCANGVYFARLSLGDGAVVRRLVIAR